MMRLIPASRAIVLATGIVLAATTFAMAEDTASTTEPAAAKPAEPFKPTIYVGPAFGYADQQISEFGWAMHIAMRVIEYGALQVEYFNLGTIPHDPGELDGLYVGIMPILPVGHGVSLFGQVGAAFSDAGDDVAGGGGVLYELPIEFLETNHVDLVMRLDYKYLNIEDGDHLITLGFMFGLHK
jgi:hypothetical protein